jgi:phage/plasmid-associated DNA primase
MQNEINHKRNLICDTKTLDEFRSIVLECATHLDDEDVMLKIDELKGKLCPNAHRFISTSLWDLEKRHFLTMKMGLAMTTNTSNRAYNHLYSIGKSGKTKILEALEKCLGWFATTGNKFLIIKGAAKKGSDQTSFLSAIENKRFVHLKEFGEKDQICDDMMKTLVEGGHVTTREMWKKESNMDVFATFIGCSNHKIYIPRTATGTMDRLDAVNMNTRFYLPTDPPEHRPRPGTASSGYCEERDMMFYPDTPASKAFAQAMQDLYMDEFFTYISLSAFVVYHELRHNPIKRPPSVLADTKAFCTPGDLLLVWVSERCTVVDKPTQGTALMIAFDAFNTWLLRCRETEWNRSKFSAALQHHGWYKKAGQSSRTNQGWFVNLKLNKVTNPPQPTASKSEVVHPISK